MGVKLEGKDRLFSALDKLYARQGDKFHVAINKAGDHLLSEAQEITPVDTGALQASGISYSEGFSWNTVVIVGFGEPVTGFYKGNRERHPEDYAVYQHDHPYMRQWLEIAVVEQTDRMTDMVFQILAK